MSQLLRRYAPPVLFVLTALLVKLLLRDYVLEQESPFVLFFSAVLLSAWWGGLGTGIAATAVCAWLALTFFLRTPGEALHVDEVIRTVVFLLEGIFVSVLAEALQRSRRNTEVALARQQTAIATLAEEIDARKQMEDDLRVAHQRLTFHMKNSPLGAIEWDRDFRIIGWSPQCEQIFGWPAEEVVGRHPSEFRFIPDEDAYEVHRVMTELQSGTLRNTMRNRNYTRDGETITCEWYNSVLFDAAGMPESIQSLVLDVSDRVRAEQELRQLTDALEHRVDERTAELRSANEHLAARELALSRSNAELESFAYVASHDLQEPLRMVASYTQLLERRYRDRLDDDAREFIEYAVDGVRRMQRLINDLLAYSRIDRRGGEPALTPAADAVEAALANLRAAIEESGARIEVGELPEVHANDQQLVQLFQNLIGNAIKFRGNEPPRIRISAERRGEQWELTVRDNGIGIEPAFADRIFVIFQRLHTRTAYPGTGIGLAICKKIVERHGGRIWLDTSVTGGAALKFTLPAHAHASEHAAAPAIAGAV